MPLRCAHGRAMLWMTTTITAFALSSTTSLSVRGVGAIRSSVDRDFLRARFQAHLLHRDWLPQSASTSSAFSSPSDHAATASKHESLKNKVLFVTAVYGDYEKTLKEPVQQQHPADFVAFTDHTDLSSPTWQIRLVEDPLDYLFKHGGRVGVGASASVNSATAAGDAAPIQAATSSPSPSSSLSSSASSSSRKKGRAHGSAARIAAAYSPAVDGINSLAQNRHPFNLAKVFKMQFYRFFDLSEYRAAVWLDATVRIISPQTAGIALMLVAQETRNLVTFEHARGGLMSAEVAASKSEKYEGTHWGCCDQPYQNMTRQYEEYLQEGFTEKWWLDEYDAPMGISKRPEWGMWVTCFVAFDLQSPKSFEFLDAWWRENVIRTTQDQVTFPYLAWKMKVYPFSLPSPGVSGGTADHNDLFEKTPHGLRRR